MSAYERCPTCKEIVNFGIDRLGRVYVVCPVCDEGRPPFLTQQQKDNLRVDANISYCLFDLCGKAYTRTSNSQKYCCSECKDAHHREYERIGGGVYAQFLADLPERRCLNEQGEGCGKIFKPTAQHQKWCSYECKTKAGINRHARVSALKRAAKREALARQQASAA